MENLLTVEEVAALLQKPVVTLYDWRYKHRGPRAIKLGTTLRYRPSDVEAWLDAQADAAPGRPAA